MSEEDEVDFNGILITTIVMNCIIILITIYLIFLTIKSKGFHSYSYGNILILSFVLFLDSTLRLVHISSKSDYEAAHYIQAFLLASLDKYIPLILTGQMFIIYMGIMQTDFYHAHKKAIFLILLFSSLGFSFIIGGSYLSFGLVKYGIYYYVQGEQVKQVTDTIFNSIFLALNCFFSGVVILNTALRKEDIEKGMLNEDDYEHELYRMILLTFANSLFYVESYLIVWDKLPVPDDYIDLVYIITCLIINLIYTINKVVIKETKKIFCKNPFVKNTQRINTYKRTSQTSEEGTSRTDSET